MPEFNALTGQPSHDRHSSMLASGTRTYLPVLLVLFMGSGCAALIYEVVWLRQISLVMGHTVYALSAVLTVFLGGLALGAYLGGRWVHPGFLLESGGVAYYVLSKLFIG